MVAAAARARQLRMELAGVAYARRRVAVSVLTWHPSEFGRRSACDRFAIVRARDGGWELFEVVGEQWERLLGVAPTIVAAQQLAERVVARAAAEERRRQPQGGQ